jgi:Na+:H+ antiporter
MISTFELASILIALVALAGWLNAKTLRIPPGVAMLIAGLAGALLLGTADALGLAGVDKAIANINRIDFSTTVTQYMLAFLLFAGAMQVNVEEARRLWMPIGILATLGVVATTVIVGCGVFLIARLLSQPLPLGWALVFGALISPTDPIAVLATVKHGRLSNRLKVILQAEALFNDGVGIVVFSALLALAVGTGRAGPTHAVFAVFIQSLGGFAFGTIASMLVIRAMGTMDDFAVETSMTIALAMGAFAGAQALGLSGAISVVGAGMLFGSERAKQAVSGETEGYLRAFWTLVDEILNALLFLLLGIELLVVHFNISQLGLLPSAIALVLLARLIVVMPWGAFYRARRGEPGATSVLAWGGLHGALSLALALSLPEGPQRALILSLTYAVVAFSIVAQGLTFGPLARKVARVASTSETRSARRRANQSSE